jgi:predicted transposase YbfD/YdcC
VIPKKKYCLVSHDAGGAENLSSWAKYNSFDYIYCKGPAIKIFKSKIRFKNENSLSESIKKSDIIITSTSWDSNLELNAIKIAKKYKKKTISILDHWNNYRERFIRNRKIILPNEIWVVDQYAFNLAKNIFDVKKIKLLRNYYKLDIEKEIIKKNKKNKKNTYNILYLAEPIEKHAAKQHDDKNYWGYTEYTLLESFFKNIHKMTNKVDNIIFRLHPSEARNKYNKIIKNYSNKYKISISSNKSLNFDINRSDIIVGCQSMAMVIALYSKKKVFSCLPTNLHKPVLPHKKIIYL